ncbi:homoserine dehydrogenase [Caldicellulosiruptor obsidiansis OB47]|uniref:Homoserine dehydrogenase n=1 Tax=Caldicellulosiruptor obsidiansis (strain ATCC BAA-2073 / JCM 16842 / OB47) TaxID=608506 RepID=D9TFS6_CALOO|nr:homoserine dehydrogenase [Caldicellulosiruptor obsidiansis]ADL43046.1 homoserine dehydrogenase [Caldicellulosiruptor obsidiansis OB47]
MAKVAIMGFGVVGSGVWEVLTKNASSIAKRAGEEISVKYILDIRDFPDHPAKDLMIKDFDVILNDPEVSIVVETIGGLEPAYTYTKKLLLNRKHVVTSNKELVAKHGPELLKIAKENNINYLFEASVGGGIPIIRPLQNCLAGNQITEIAGILNGTTNYILTQMKKYSLSFEDALKEAQEKGYAERNPSNDIEGHDACRKIAILSSIAYSHYVNYENIYTEGISKITKEDMEYAEELGCTIKLIAMSKKLDNKRVFARVSPLMISYKSPFANVDDVFNAILVKGDAIGDVMFYGQGAGKLPTASAVVGDIIDIVKHIDKSYVYTWAISGDIEVVDIENTSCRFFVRVKYKDYTKAKDAVSLIFNDCMIVNTHKPIGTNEFAFVTHEMKESEFKEKISQLEKIPVVEKVLSIIRYDENI